MRMLATAVGCAIAANFALSANAGAAIVNGFESPEFTPGLLDGQSGWTNHNGNAAIDTANPRSGAQHVRLRNTQGDRSALADGPHVQEGSYAMSFWFSTSDTSNRFSAKGFELTSGEMSWQISISGSTLRIEDELGSDFTASIPVIADQYHQVAVVYNPIDDSRDYFFDGLLAFHQTIGLMPGQLTHAVSLDLRHSPGGFVDVDDITYSVVPSPGSIALACMGTVMSWRRRR
jgi:hypothetical protein